MWDHTLEKFLCAGLVVSFSFCLALNSFAQEQFLVSEIKVIGLRRTKLAVVQQEVGFRENSFISREDIEAGVQRLRNTQLFSQVTYKLEQEISGSRRLVITVNERWTTIPIFKFSSGGGVNQLALGVFDSNILGHYTESGAQYERLGATNSGVVWFKNPRLFGKRLTLDLQTWRTNRLRKKYFQERIEPEIKTGFLHTRTKFVFRLEQEWVSWLRVGATAESHIDRFSKQYLEEETQAKVEVLGLPPDSKVLFYGVHVGVGNLNYDSYLVDGALAQLSYRHGIMQTNEAGSDFDEWELGAYYYKTLPWQITVGERILAGGTSTETLQYWHYLGGLDRIRGFADNRFAGRYFWLSNSEIRLPLYTQTHYVIQGITFYDVVAVGEEPKELDTATGASIGGGLRFIMPKIYRLVARLDYAKPLLKHDEMPISFGFQQFF